jgi:hypothetical protein
MATVGDLYRLPHHQKAELVRGELMMMSPTATCRAARPARSWSPCGITRDEPAPDGPTRTMPRSCTADPSAPTWPSTLVCGPGGVSSKGAPRFAVEVRSESDYGLRAERAMAEKRGDYFAAGTEVVWDVDVLREECAMVYRASVPEHPAVYQRGEKAEAEPALPGWRLAVDSLFE